VQSIAKSKASKTSSFFAQASNEINVQPGSSCASCVYRDDDSACAGLCATSLDNVKMSNTMTVSSEAILDLNDADRAQIKKDIDKTMLDQFGVTDTSDEYNTRLTEFIAKVTTDLQQSTRQFTIANNRLLVNGTGVSAGDIGTDIVVAAVLDAVSKTCPTDQSGCGVDMLSDVVQAQINTVKKNITQSVKKASASVWDQVKSDVMYMAAYILFLFLVYFGLIFYKAAHAKKS
jgi:hypothetical protein